ncbi:N-acyl-D-glucosamine 2-epimerase [Chloroflexia bacterium SDU3-3]|nr:N-acyl-D-glucosamine 2-epimerase [Chloroflexia bacterium SDU3-3]
MITADASTILPQLQQARVQIEQELLGNILPFWIEHTCDEEHGGFYGALSNDLVVHNEYPRSAVVCARILWTYAAAYRAYGKDEYRTMAQRAYEYLKSAFVDPVYGGVYWQIDQDAKPISPRKHSYAQSFAIYGLSEYHRATGDAESLELAKRLFELLEQHAYEPHYGGYIEGCAHDWGLLDDMRLSDLEPNCRKSMNTMLHVMEGYTNLLRVWDSPLLRQRVHEMVEIFLKQIIDPQTYHFKLFFDDAWNASGQTRSYGHDIEGSWLIVEAAEVLDDPKLLAASRSASVEMAWAVYSQGMDSSGGVLYEGHASGPASTDKHWWAQAEAIVGFYNAYQISGHPQFAEAALACWDFVQKYFVDRTHGEWFKVVSRDGTPHLDQVKTGPWECPYHHGRFCLELLARIPAQ